MCQAHRLHQVLMGKDVWETENMKNMNVAVTNVAIFLNAILNGIGMWKWVLLKENERDLYIR